MKNICIVVGARPNFVKVAPLIRAITNLGSSSASYSLVYAGKDNDPTLETSLFSDLMMPPPDTFLGVDSSSLNEITSQVMARFDAYLDSNPTDVVIVVDDLASTMAAAIVAKKRGLTLAHLVAGTRSFDMKMPKEVNRLVIDALSDFLFTAGTKSSSVATREQAEGSNTYMVGNILMDTLRFCRQYLRKPDIDIEERKFLVLTINRRALLADSEKLRQLLLALTEAAGDIPIIAPLRGEARNVVVATVPAASPVGLTLLPPLSYLEFGWLTAHALGIVTDSGNVAEEATFNGVPCITLNSYTEHQETVTIGTNVLVGEDPQRLAEETRRMVSGEWKESALPDRWDGRTAERIVKILLD
jgi:UDP-N-acetylglucosamine 2-epimerase (non-hydrolysing)